MFRSAFVNRIVVGFFFEVLGLTQYGRGRSRSLSTGINLYLLAQRSSDKTGSLARKDNLKSVAWRCVHALAVRRHPDVSEQAGQGFGLSIGIESRAFRLAHLKIGSAGIAGFGSGSNTP